MRAGALGDLFPTSVVQGMLAAIGVIIFCKQVHVMLGVRPDATTPLGLLSEIPRGVARMNPAIAAIGAASLAILFALPRVQGRWVRRVPPPLVALVVTVTRPDFGAILTGPGVKHVVMFALVGTLAVDILAGVGLGVAVKVGLNLAWGMRPREFLAPAIDVDGASATVRVRGAAVFSNFVALRRRVEDVAAQRVTLDFSEATLVDHCVVEHLAETRAAWAAEGRELVVAGLDSLRPVSPHPLAARRRRGQSRAGDAAARETSARRSPRGNSAR